MSHATDLIVISEEEAGLRVDKLLKDRFPQHSRTYFQYLLEEGCVLSNGIPLKKREKLNVGDEIEICFLLTPEISLEPENIPLEILYEDEHFLAVNKPSGMVVHPAPGHPSKTFVNALLFHCKELEKQEGDLRPGIVHRLDKDTSGILLAAKTREAHKELIALFAERKIEKTYTAICVGKTTDGVINAPIGRHPQHRKEMCVRSDGKSAISHVRTLMSHNSLSVVEVDLITGRTHQIRVHLKSAGTPILGDPVYGFSSVNEKWGITAQMLHAQRICMLHPILKTPLEIVAPLPQAMQEFIIEHLEPVLV
jgi:23S rRNA pseudouridine1911/1915/1917 synthase